MTLRVAGRGWNPGESGPFGARRGPGSGLMRRTYVFASLKTLEYLRRGGRMNCAIAHFGEFLQLGPLLHMSMGEASAHRTRTNERARQHLLD